MNACYNDRRPGMTIFLCDSEHKLSSLLRHATPELLGQLPMPFTPFLVPI